MQKISFVLPIMRFEESDKLATRTALIRALDITDADIDRMVSDAHHHKQFVVNFRVHPAQFSAFLIYRNDMGGKNWFADMKPRVLDNDAGIVNKRIVDFTLHGDSWKTGYRIHDDLPQPWVDRHNENKENRRFTREGHERHFSGGSAYDPNRFRMGTDTYDVAAGETDGPYDMVFGKDGRLKSSKFAVRVRHWRSGSVALQFKQPPVNLRPSVLGTEMHKAIDALMEPVIKERDALAGMLRQAISVLTQGGRVVTRLRASLSRFRDLPFNNHGQSAVFLRHSENLVNDAKSLLSNNGDEV